MKKTIISVLFLSFLLMIPLQNFAKITITTVKEIRLSDCPGKDGKNHLKPVPVAYLGAPQQWFFNEITNGDTKFPKDKWTFKKGSVLNGKLIIDRYLSKFKAAHHSGALISIRYQRGKNDPENLRWVQMIETSNPLHGAKPPYIDPYPNDDPENKDLPFYYTEEEIKTRRNGKNKAGKYDVRFYDFSSRGHPPTSGAKWRARLHLASWDKNTNTVTIHDGVRWGWVGGCKAGHTTDDKNAHRVFDPETLVQKKKPEKDPKIKKDTKDPAIKKPPKGSKVIFPGKAVAGKPISVTAVGPDNNVLTGVVIECGEEQRTTDSDGRATFQIPSGITQIPIELVELSLQSISPLDVIDPSNIPFEFSDDLPPQIEECPRFVVPSDEIPITGGPFDSDIDGNKVKIGESDADVLACSPVEIRARVPSDIPVGSKVPMTVTTENGTCKPVDLTIIRFRLEADTTKLFKGQWTKGRLIIDGTDQKVKIEIKNLTPGVIALKGGNVLSARTKGGKNNYCTIRFKGLNKGKFGITAKVTQTIKIKRTDIR